jgi:amidase
MPAAVQVNRTLLKERAPVTHASLHDWTLVDLSDAIRRRAISPVDATEALLHRIEHLDGKHHSYATVLAERARAQAKQAEVEITRGFWRGVLHGVPVAVKDLCNSTYAPTTSGMPIFSNFQPSHNATVVDRLEQAGAIILGKLKMTEGAYSAHHPDISPPLNPWQPDHWVGSSSSGSGVATAAGLCFGSLGSDTGGSIRLPSTCCGLTGIKPTWGRVSRYGVFPLAPSLDHIGPMTRSAADAAAMLGVIAGADPNDPTALQGPVPDYLAHTAGSLRGLRIGLDEEYAFAGTDPQVVAAVQEAARALTDAGATIRPVTFPPYQTGLAGWMSFCGVETALVHEATYPARASEYGPELAGLIEHGRGVSSRDLAAILIERQIFASRLAALFGEIDLLLLPVIPVAVPTLTEWKEIQGDSRIAGMLKYTAPFNLSGTPTITLPCGFDRAGLPIGMQLAGPDLSEPLLCRAGAGYQRATDWHTRHPA